MPQTDIDRIYDSLNRLEAKMDKLVSRDTFDVIRSDFDTRLKAIEDWKAAFWIRLAFILGGLVSIVTGLLTVTHSIKLG